MATRLKTISFCSSFAAFVNNTLTTVPATSVFIPESGTKTFRSVKVSIHMADAITATGGTVTTKTVSLGLAGGTKTTITNTNTLTNSAENLSLILSYDFAQHFQTYWTGTTMDVDLQVLTNTTTGTFTNSFTTVCATLEITYEYDDTSTTQIKTVRMPLNAPTGALPTAAGTNIHTIPAISTYFPESSKVFRNIFLTAVFNEHAGTGVTDITLALKANGGADINYVFEKALATNRFNKLIIKIQSLQSTPALQDLPYTIEFYSAVAALNHMQLFVTFTYEYDESASTSIYNSLMLPMEVASPFGGPTSSNYQRATRDIWIQEPGPITTKEIAFFPYWTQATNLTGLNMRIGTGSFVAYTDNLSVIAGSNCAMVRNDTAFTLARGKNSLNFDAYTTGATSLGWGISGFWIVNYISAKSSLGSGAHNHSVSYSITDQGTGAIEMRRQTSALSIQIPESEYFINALGTEFIFLTSGTLSPGGFSIQIERLAAEGGIQWEVAYKDMISSDSEVGVYLSFSQMRDVFKRFPDDVGVERIDIETARRWRIFSPISTSSTGTGWGSLNVLITYHTITYNVSGTIIGLTGSRTIDLWRNTGEKFKTQTLGSDGVYNFTWYDDTIPIFITAKDSTKMLVSQTKLATETIDIGSSGGSSGPTYYAR